MLLGQGSYYKTLQSIKDEGQALGWSPQNQNLGLYLSLPQAIFESFLLLQKVFSHKKKVVLFNGASPYQKIIQAWCLSRGIETEVFLWSRVEQDISEALLKDPGVFVLPFDHAVSGEHLPTELLELLKGKRLGVLTWAHHHYLTMPTWDHPYRIWAQAIEDGGEGLAFHGDRLELASIVATHQSYHYKSGRLRAHFPELKNKELVLALKSKGIQTYLCGFGDLQGAVNISIYSSLGGRQLKEKLVGAGFPGESIQPWSLCLQGVTTDELGWIDPQIESDLWPRLCQLKLADLNSAQVLDFIKNLDIIPDLG